MNSPILGEYREPTESERIFVENLNKECPLFLFQIVNKNLNLRGYMLDISLIEEIISCTQI